jgi:catechol 2,3-dioxygenase-like lactoylglutathione lyase family enzyme
MDDRIRFHISLNVADLKRSVAFFRTLFGIEPAKVRTDYAKFELLEPPLVLSLEPTREIISGGTLNHLGLRLPNSRSLVAIQERLEQAGMKTQREEGVECCYARQTKFWVCDPDGNLWEFYTLDSDIDHRGAGQSVTSILETCAKPASESVWEHRIHDPIPPQISVADGTVDEIRLRGTLNLSLSQDQRNTLFAQVRRALKPGGRLFVHVLSGDQHVENPSLPGPAGVVRVVPSEREVMAWLEQAGFVNIRMTKFDAKPCFVRDGIAMRESQFEGFTPPHNNNDQVEVMYKGPFCEVRDDLGRSYPRGQRVLVPSSVADYLRSSDLAEQFTIFPAKADRSEVLASCGS